MIRSKATMSRWMSRFCLAATALLLLRLVQPALAQEAAQEQAVEKQGTQQSEQSQKTEQEHAQATVQSETPDTEQASQYKSGYEDVPQFGGPSSVGAELQEADEVKEPFFRFPKIGQALKPWFDLKERINRRLGLQFGLDYSALYQVVTESPGEDQAASGIFRFYGSWTLLDRDSGNTGALVYKVEHRHRLGTDITPQELGFEAGSILPTGTMFNQFSNHSWGVTNLYWQQRLFKGRLSFIAGKVDPTDYLDIYGLINPLTAFTNLAFSTNPTIPAPNQGLGAALGVMATDNVYAVGGLADANGDATEAGFDTFFEDHEYFSHIEVGWVSSFERRYFDNIHLTAWHVNEREEARVPDGWGLAFSATWFINDQWMPFLRAGYSDDGGALLEGMVSAGIGRYFSKSRDLIGFGVSWGRPSGTGLDDQYTAELFYRLQLA
ncbi:MAG: carbohydrate porin, partial [Candidatus Hydrogenedentes bacterium]|nr:carbohydrate porin [Candidatus Hydrogenedentota bacterium]